MRQRRSASAAGPRAGRARSTRDQRRYSSRAFYLSQGGPIETTAWFLETLLAAPDQSLDLLPSGKARATRLTDLEVGSGASRQTITLWSVTGISNSPLQIWSDAKNKFFALTVGLAWLPEAYVDEQSKIEAAQAKAMAAQAPALLKSLVTVPTQPVAFTGVRLFDADGLRFLPDQTVVVDRGIDRGRRPARARRGAGRRAGDRRARQDAGPGLWDCHMHVGDDFTGVQELSLGVTSIRDPGNDDARTIDRRKRIDGG